MRTRLGWHNRGYLHHFDGYGAAQRVVFRTRASLPSNIIQQTEAMDQSEARIWLDQQLDHSTNGRIFLETRPAGIMEETLRYFDGERFDLLAWCIMPSSWYWARTVWAIL
jgi:putative transposase